MIQYLNFLLLCSLAALLGAAACYLYFQMKTLLKKAEASIDDLHLEVSYVPPKSDVKCQKLIECALTRNSKHYLSKACTEERVNELSADEVDKLFSNYEGKLLGQMVKSLGKSIIRMYSLGACAALGMSNQDALSDDLESDQFLNSALQRFVCELYYQFGSFLAPLSIGLITSSHYFSEQNIAGTKNGDEERDK